MNNNFDGFGLASPLKESLRQLNFNIPTPIQAETLPITLVGKNLVGCAQTGSGKTAAYCLPLIQRLMENPKEMALILVPTRELVAQVGQVLRDFLHNVDGIRSVELIGGESISLQMKMLKKKPFPRIIVATPGRLNDLIRRSAIYLKTISFLVLDEADRMLDMGFAPQLKKIDEKLSKKENRQTLMFSATMPQSVDNLVKQFICDEVRITLGHTRGETHHIRQSVVSVNPSTKNVQLLDELENIAGSVIIFLASKHRTDRLARFLVKSGHQVSRIHGDRSQSQRTRAMRDFRSGKTQILVATDIAARGLDVPQIGTVINFDLPRAAEDYIHRIGRSGRAGEVGASVSFVSREDRFQWNKIIKKCRLNIDDEREGSAKEDESVQRDVRDESKGKRRTKWSGERGNRSNHSGSGRRKRDQKQRAFGKSSKRNRKWHSETEIQSKPVQTQKKADRGLVVSQTEFGIVLKESERPFKPKFKSKSKSERNPKGNRNGNQNQNRNQNRSRNKNRNNENFSAGGSDSRSRSQRKNARARGRRAGGAKRRDRFAVAV